MTISTKTGDKGTTQWQDKRLSKGEVEFEFIGHLDELNGWLGMIKSLSNSTEINHFLTHIQKDIMLISSLQAFRQLMDEKEVIERLRSGLKELEEKASQLEKELPSQKHFIIPGGVEVASVTNLARAVCRRAERAAVNYFHHRNQTIGKEITLAYLNRLSDYLHLLIRWFNFHQGNQEEYWA